MEESPKYYDEQKKPGTKELILFDFFLHKVLGQAELIYGDRNQDSGCLWQGGWAGKHREGKLCISSAEVVTQRYPVVKTYHTVHSKSVYFILC